ncbi:MAG: hypothetical protein ACR2H3_07470 [Acidimicrobiales bacterium]
MVSTFERQELYSGFGDALARAVEYVAVPLLFALFGHFLDGRLHTGIVLTVALGSFGFVGVSLRAWFAYVAAMQAEEEKASWRAK